MSYTKNKLLIFSYLPCLIFVLLCSSCKNHNNIYKISQANLYLKIQDRNDFLRIYIGKNMDELCLDYIDIDRRISDMPGISICFVPNYPKNLYVLDRWKEVRNIKEEKFCIIQSEPFFTKNEEGLSIITYSDTTVLNNRNILMQLSAYVDGFMVWDGEDYIGKAPRVKLDSKNQ